MVGLYLLKIIYLVLEYVKLYLFYVFFGKSIMTFLHYGYTVQTAPAQDITDIL